MNESENRPTTEPSVSHRHAVRNPAGFSADTEEAVPAITEETNSPEDDIPSSPVPVTTDSHIEDLTVDTPNPVAADPQPEVNAANEHLPLTTDPHTEDNTVDTQESESVETPTDPSPQVSSNPRLPSPIIGRYADSIHTHQIDLLVAVLPLLAWACYLYGWRPLTLTASAVIAAILAETLGRLLFRRTTPIDLSPLTIAVLLVLALPPTVPLWLPAVGAAVAVFFFLQLFGGTGCQRLIPAVASLALLWLAFPSYMTAGAADGQLLSPFSMTVESYTAIKELPLAVMKNGYLPEISLGALFVGLRPGLMMGESSALLLIAAGFYLFARKVVSPTFPLAFIATVAVLAYAFPTLAAVTDIMALQYMGYHLLGGELLFGVLFLAADSACRPHTKRGQMAAGVIGGAVTVLMRYAFHPALGVPAALVVVSLLSRPLDCLLLPTPFGGKRKKG